MSSAEIVGKRIKARAVYCSSLSKPALDKTIKDLKDGSNWKKYEATYGELIALFSWGDEIARIVGEKTGVEAIHTFLRTCRQRNALTSLGL